MEANLTSKDFRAMAWHALQHDDADALFTVLRNEEGVRGAARGLWNPNKESGIRERPLVNVLSCNTKGVPSHGAINCLSALLERYGHLFAREELRAVARRARRKNREQVAVLLETAPLGDTEEDRDSSGEEGEEKDL